MEDDFHHFRIALHHRDGIVTGVESEAMRTPYDLCAAAGGRLAEMVGLRLSERATDVPLALEARQQCTHQLDLAALAFASAARGHGRSYSAFVGDPIDDSRRATLRRDDRFQLSWIVRDETILGAPPFGDLSMGAGFTDLMSRLGDADLAEAALVLRRAWFVSRGRQRIEELNKLGHARPKGGCWVQQPERAFNARRIITAVPEGRVPRTLNPEDEAWLGLAEADQG